MKEYGMAELDEHGNLIPGTAAPALTASDQREITDGGGNTYRRMSAIVGDGRLAFYMVKRDALWESVPAETLCIHPATGAHVSLRDLPWDGSDPH